jgi:uncharacterized heparinase superfamily protein
LARDSCLSSPWTNRFSAASIADLVQSWAASFGEWHPEAWAPELVAERLYAWLWLRASRRARRR